MGGVFPDENLDLYRKEFSKFKAISIREPQFITETSELAGQEVVDVCDPSLLLTKEEYQQVENPKRCPKKYIAVFDLAGDNLVRESALALKKKYGVPIVNLSGKYEKWADVSYFGLSPNQWIYLMRNADYVCTNSFHGVAFSIIFNRQFVCCKVSKGARSKTNGRVENLLTQLNLMDRYINTIDEINDILIDYAQVNVHLENYRNRSFNWLKSALEL